MGKKKHRPKTKAELLQAQWERERPRPPRPAAGWMQRAAEWSNRAIAALVMAQERRNLKEKARQTIEEEAQRIIEEEREGEGEALNISAEAVAGTPVVLPDAGREGPAIGGLEIVLEVSESQSPGKPAGSLSAILGETGK